MKFSKVAPDGFWLAQYGSAARSIRGFAGTVPSIVTRPATVPAFDSSTRFAFAGGPAGAVSGCARHAAAARTATAKNARNPFICMSLYKYHRKRCLAPLRKGARHLSGLVGHGFS